MSGKPNHSFSNAGGWRGDPADLGKDSNFDYQDVHFFDRWSLKRGEGSHLCIKKKTGMAEQSLRFQLPSIHSPALKLNSKEIAYAVSFWFSWANRKLPLNENSGLVVDLHLTKNVFRRMGLHVLQLQVVLVGATNWKCLKHFYKNGAKASELSLFCGCHDRMTETLLRQGLLSHVCSAPCTTRQGSLCSHDF